MLELAVPVWHSGLTLKETADIERIQKVAFRIILREQYISYQQACSALSSPTLEQRRETLCLEGKTSKVTDHSLQKLKLEGYSKNTSAEQTD